MTDKLVPAWLGTSSVLDVPSSGDATSTQVVLGSDTRLTNARTPTSHAASHASAGSDPVTPASIGAATSAQGVKADTAVQPGDLATVATSGAYGDLTGTPVVPDPTDGTAGQVWTTDGSTGSWQAGGGQPPGQLAPPNWWFGAPSGSTDFDIECAVSGAITTTRMDIPTDVTIVAVGTAVGTAQPGATVKIVLWRLGSDGLPVSLVGSWTIDASSTGTRTATISPAVTLPMGAYRYGLLASGAGVKTQCRLNWSNPVGPIGDTANRARFNVGFGSTFAAGTYAVPANPAAPIGTNGANQNIPVVVFQRSP